ncbi:pyridoxamine 5'-phosphate oxidase [Sphingomicrobium clamense]|uniref:Pyridoxamine 5'-phosphate oxidase n=1 Tax=Sphingomicrobium clamense TaxID=2851013 RepID=A0ABS6V821_9SPHN|nr:pyridoxamine 5'-phosphate oxidase [Sphingomicrobium sp. B8]MBW0145731.1 pyridoxamine 5'-phosphate oxidase [Sphingomicrobium sp. B8]
MNPFDLFNEWYEEAKASEPSDPNAMAVATATAEGRPSVRMVLFKDHGPDGWVFYTNTLSRKGEELAENDRAALCIHWKSSYKQVRIEGPVEQVTDAEADAYFASRERSKQLAASASLQSQELESRELFEAKVDELDKLYCDSDLPRPPHWTGYRVIPRCIEFWEGTQERMHHRRLFTDEGNGRWSETLLYP